MYAKIVALFALIAVAFAAPKPEPSPQAVFYNYPAGAVDYYPTFGALAAAPAGYPYASAGVLPYSAYPGAYFLKK